MVERDEVIQKLENLTGPIFQNANLDLVDIEFGSERSRGLIRFYIDRTEGVTVSDCETISRRLSEILDEHQEIIPGSYSLEVSSPGLDRPFKKERDYERNLGRLVKIVTKAPMDGKNVFIGLLDDFKHGKNGNDSKVVIREEESMPAVELQMSDIAVARLEVNWDSLFGEKKKKPKRR